MSGQSTPPRMGPPPVVPEPGEEPEPSPAPEAKQPPPAAPQAKRPPPPLIILPKRPPPVLRVLQAEQPDAADVEMTGSEPSSEPEVPDSESSTTAQVGDAPRETASFADLLTMGPVSTGPTLAQAQELRRLDEANRQNAANVRNITIPARPAQGRWVLIPYGVGPNGREGVRILSMATSTAIRHRLDHEPDGGVAVDFIWPECRWVINDNHRGHFMDWKAARGRNGKAACTKQ